MFVHILVFAVAVDGLILSCLRGIEQDSVSLLPIGQPVLRKLKADPSLRTDKFLAITGRGILTPAGLIITDTAIFKPDLHHAVIIARRILVNLAGHPAHLADTAPCKPLHHIDVMNAAVNQRRTVPQKTFVSVPVDRVMVLYHTDQLQLPNGACLLYTSDAADD